MRTLYLIRGLSLSTTERLEPLLDPTWHSPIKGSTILYVRLVNQVFRYRHMDLFSTNVHSDKDMVIHKAIL